MDRFLFSGINGFGTFQEEMDQVPPVYGITRPVSTWNPIKINFQHLWLLIKDAARTKNLKDKFRIWFMPTGWRPDDIVESDPVHKILDVYHFEKYDTKASMGLHIWAWVQLFILLLMASYLFGNISMMNTANPFYIYLYGFILFLDVYAYSELMDRKTSAWIFEGIKCIY
jgi:hypothetical protein